MNNQVLLTEKKQWITPKMDIISKDVIQIGTTPVYLEGSVVFNGSSTVTGSAS